MHLIEFFLLELFFDAALPCTALLAHEFASSSLVVVQPLPRELHVSFLATFYAGIRIDVLRAEATLRARQTDRFAAASVNYPVTNWFSFVGTTDGAGWYHNFEKFPWEDPSEHLRRSPLMYVGNVTTPTMLICGENDLRRPISQTEEYYHALKMQKVPTVMVRFNDEFHGTSRKPGNLLSKNGSELF